MGLFGANLTGYNCQKVNELRNAINNTAQQSAQGIVERLNSDIVVPMSSAWYAPEAVTFFEGFASTVKATGENITAAFDAFRAAVESAGRSWAENTGGEIPSLPAIDTVQLNLNISSIQNNNAGNVVIDENRATAIANRLQEVEEGIKNDLRNLAGNLNAETAFIGQGQAEALENCFVTISGEIHKIFKYLTVGEDSLQGQINKAVKKYQDVSSGISSAFNNSTVQ